LPAIPHLVESRLFPAGPDLVNWEKKGPILDFGRPGEDDAMSAAYGVTYRDGNQWHMFYLGTPNVSPGRIWFHLFPI
jgi:hypothetical protein